MPIDILMPALSPTMEKGNLAKWHVKEGDTVAPGDVIAEIETDKATMEVEAVDEGRVGRLLVEEGAADVPVNEVIALLLGEDEDESALESAGRKEAAPAGRAEAAPAASPEAKEEKKEKEKPDATSGASREAAAAGSGNGAAAPQVGAGPVPRTSGERIFASPLARRLAREQGIDLASIDGSGPRGRIVQRDIEAAVESGAAKQAPAAAEEAKPAPAAPGAAPAPSMTDDQIKAFFEKGSYEEKPHDGMRKTIARRLVSVTQEVPVFYLTVDIAVDALLGLRSEINQAAPRGDDDKPAYRLSVNDFIIKAMAKALMARPMANATWTESARLLHRHADIGVAVAVPDGLFTPVIRRAEEKSLSAISNEMKDLASRARSKKLKPDEYQGGVTAISNLGMYGIRDFTAIINPPHATILAVGASEKRPVVRDDAVAVETQMSATLACDHRVLDGALGAELLGEFKRFVENPMTMLV
jgi:pyruvate dehydrogenase E2 component (dihydrolipoamide acetyltransferase)